MTAGRWVVCVMVMVGIIMAYPEAPRADSPLNTPLVGSRPRPSVHLLRDPRLYDEMTVQGQQARGLYLGGLFVQRVGISGIVRAVREAGLDAVVIDMKDGAGRVTYDTQIPILQESKARWAFDARAIIAGLKAEGIYTIARVTCFADPKLPARHPERSIMHVRRDEPWVSWGTGDTWLDPYNRANHDMIVDIAREVEAVGFDEIQLDYVRFPVDAGVQYARYPSDDGTTRSDLLIEMLRRIDLMVHIPLGVDVFGLAAYREGDPSGLGQDLVAWRDYVEVYSPMLYTNAMRSWRRGEPHRARNLVLDGVDRLRERLGPESVIRPYLQGFERGSGGVWGANYIAEQVIGARRGRSDGFLWWHPGSRYTMVRRGMVGPAAGLHPFPIPEARSDAREARRVEARRANRARRDAEGDEPGRSLPQPGVVLRAGRTTRRAASVVLR